jgi:hypothetical protein
VAESERRRAIRYAARVAGILTEHAAPGDVVDVSTAEMPRHGSVITVVYASGPATGEARYSLHEIERTPAGVDKAIELRAMGLYRAVQDELYGLIETTRYDEDTGERYPVDTESIARIPEEDRRFYLTTEGTP